MIKKSLVLLATSLALAIVQPMAIAAVKPGSACLKVGQTSTSSGMKYTCVKSGKKLVWDKGVAIKAPSKPEETPAPSIEMKDLLSVDSRISSTSELTTIETCKTEDKTPDYLALGKLLHKNGFPRPANSSSGKKSAKVLVIPMVFNDLAFKTVKAQTGQVVTSDLDMLNDVIPRVKEQFKLLSAGRFEITIDVLPQSQWWVINSDNPLKYGPQLNNFPEIVFFYF